MRFARSLLPFGAALLALPAAVTSSAVEDHDPAGRMATATPTKHVVVIFQENVSFDHYFGTYPNATNQPGEPQFHPSARTPSVNGLNENLLTSNPNTANPQRLDRSQPLSTSSSTRSIGSRRRRTGRTPRS